MALPELLRALREQAADRRAEELAHAQATCDRILEASRGAVALRREEYLSGVRQSEEDAARRTLSRARGEAARTVLAARAQLLERVRESVDALIRDAPADPTYLAVIPAELRDALGRLPPGPAHVEAHPSLLETVEPVVAAMEDVLVKAEPAAGLGYTVRSGDGRTEVDATLDGRLARDWPRLAVQVLRQVSP